MALLGDLVDSRAAPDRVASHHIVMETLDQVNDRVTPVDPLRPTVGDEFQGVYATLGQALAASFEIRLRLSPDIPVRFGIGRGEVRSIDPARGIQDGSAWWSARSAINDTEGRAAKGQTRFARSTFVSVTDDGSYVTTVQTSLDLVDYLFWTLKPKDYEIVRSLRAGRTQSEIAMQLGGTQQAISERLRRTGVGPLLHALAALKSVA